MRQPLLLNSTKLYLIWFLTPLIVLGCNKVRNDMAKPVPAAAFDETSEPAGTVPSEEEAESHTERSPDAETPLESVPEDVDVATYELIRELNLIWGSAPAQSQSTNDGEKR